MIDASQTTGGLERLSIIVGTGRADVRPVLFASRESRAALALVTQRSLCNALKVTTRCSVHVHICSVSAQCETQNE